MDYDAHLADLRQRYYRAYPRQRVGVIRDRLLNPSRGPNQLVTYVSALEGLLRSLVIWGEAHSTNSERPTQAMYDKYKLRGVEALLLTYLSQNNLARQDLIPDDGLLGMPSSIEIS